jgi:hypothetical protein
MRPASCSCPNVAIRRSLSRIVRRITHSRASAVAAGRLSGPPAPRRLRSRASLSSVTVMRDPDRARTLRRALIGPVIRVPRVSAGQPAAASNTPSPTTGGSGPNISTSTSAPSTLRQSETPPLRASSRVSTRAARLSTGARSPARRSTTSSDRVAPILTLKLDERRLSSFFVCAAEGLFSRSHRNDCNRVDSALS